jgi:predicted component of type VI protein secretion system
MAGRLAVIVVLLLAGCTAEDHPIAPACLQSRDAIVRALDAAPAAVALPDGTRLSACVRGARQDADLQALGLLLTQVADGLALRAPRDPAAAVRLGYLIGAAREGAAATSGIAAELARRLERTATMDGASGEARAALASGLRAGGRTG